MPPAKTKVKLIVSCGLDEQTEKNSQQNHPLKPFVSLGQLANSFSWKILSRAKFYRLHVLAIDFPISLQIQ